MKNLFACLLLVSTVLTFSCKDHSSKNKDIEVSPHATFFPDADTFYSNWSKENTVIVHALNDPGFIHPVNYATYNAKFVLLFTHNFLMGYDNVHSSFIPQLAKEMPQVTPDHLQYSYELREEATWDDGSPITAEDIVFTYKLHKCPLTDNPNSKPYFENLKTISVDANNSRRFTMMMKREYIQNVGFTIDYPVLCRKFYDPDNVLAKYSFEQFDDPAFKLDDQEDLKSLIAKINDGKYGNDLNLFFGSGAYKLATWDRGQSVMLVKKSNYWMSKLKDPTMFETALPDKIIIKIVPDENAYTLEAKSQGLDASSWIATKALLGLQEDANFNRNYHSGFAQNYNMNYVGMNMKPDGVKHKKIFTDAKVRRAMAMLTPIDQIIQVMAKGKAARWPSMVSPLKPEYNKDLSLVPYDIEGAKKLLDEAGWIDSDNDGIRDKVVDGEKIPLRFEFTYASSQSVLKDIATMMSESMYLAGVKVELRPVDASLTSSLALSHDFDMIFLAWATPAFAEDYTQIWHTSSWASGGGNFVGFGDAESDALIDSIKYTLDDTLRYKMVRRLQKIVYDEQPYIFMYSPYRKIFIHKRFGNAVMTADLPNLVYNNLKLLAGSANVTMMEPQVQ